MEISRAQEISESAGCFFRFDKTSKMYCIYFGQSWAVINEKNLEALTEETFKTFLLDYMRHEVEELAHYGGPVRH